MPIEFNKLSWFQELPINILVESELQDILSAKSSLTKLLKKRYNNELDLSVIRNEWQKLTANDISFLNISPSNGIIREVIIKSNSNLLIFARCCIPASSLSNANKKLLMWDNKPIGEFIFSQKSHSRSDFQYSYAPLKYFSTTFKLKCSQKLVWIRKSIVKVNFLPIAIHEVFLR